jgi:phage FluMu gp28-like protein
MTWTKRAKFLIQNLDLEAASGIDGAKWEHFQLAHLNDDTILRCEAKSRQIAASFTFSAEAVANALLDNTSSLFQSINLDEAREKILYARSIYESLYMRGLPKITQPNTTTQLGFSNGARIISSPGTPQRGKARFWVYLDEWAHQTHAKPNYVAALPVVSKGGKLRGASSPMGAGGFFWEIFKEEIRRSSKRR